MNLLSMLPENFQDSPPVVELQNALDRQVDTLWRFRDDFMKQLHVATATWGLEWWEKAYGIPVDASRSLPFRRSQVLAKLRGVGAATKEMIRNVAAGFSEGETTLEEFCSEYRFRLSIDRNLDSEDIRENFIRAIEESKPAHLIWDYAIRMLCPRKVLHIAGGSYHIAETTLPPLKGVRT